MRINNINFINQNNRFSKNKKQVNFAGKDSFIKSVQGGNVVENQGINERILNEIISDFKQFEGVDCVALGGSSAVKSADNLSDFDVYIYVDKIPTPEERAKLAAKYSDNAEIDNHYFETGDVFTLRKTGKPMDIMYRNIQDMENNVDWVWTKGNASMGYTTCFVDNINKSKIMFDKSERFTKLQRLTQTPYPEKLANNIINKNFSYLKDVMFSYYDQIHSAINRNDFVSINHRISAFLASYFDVIFARNRVLNPGEKRLVQFAKENCSVLPQNFEKDINHLTIGEVSQKLSVASRMVENLRNIL